jgi:hypothetical protein
LNKN